MVGKTQAATRAQKARMDQIKMNCGCLPCLLKNLANVHCTVQHVVEGGKRLGHDFTYGSCLWHHMGPEYAENRMPGPSLANNKREFVAAFGTERQLVQTQDFMLYEFRADPWGEFDVPLMVGEKVRQYWVKLTGNSSED